MTTASKFIVQLDQPREIAWTWRAYARLDGYRPRRKGGTFYQFCANVWAALVDRDHPFEEPEDLAAYFDTREKVQAAGSVLLAARKAFESAEAAKAAAVPPAAKD